jgi:saccharopine dehydrogenase-like NADP-dependent oxidoreductase
MSSTLFGRGTNTQIGGKKRAEDQERAVLAVRTAVDELRAVSATAADVRAATARIATLEATVATLQKTVAALSSTVATLSAAPAPAEATAVATVPS